MSDPTDWDDSLTTPLEGAAEASASEGATSPAVGRDEWVARHGERRDPARRRARHHRAAAGGRPLVGVADALRRHHLPAPDRLRERVHPPRRLRHGRLHAARARAQHRRRLGRPARPRLHRVLRDRRLHVRAAQLRPVRHPPPDPRRDPDRGDRRWPRRMARRAAVAAAHRGLPRDRDAVLLPAVPHGDEQRGRRLRREHHEWAERDPERRRARRLRVGSPAFDLRGALLGQLPLRRARLLRRSSTSPCTCSTTRAPGARGGRCGKTRSPPR